MTTLYTFKPGMTGKIRLIAEEYQKMYEILEHHGFYSRNDRSMKSTASAIIAEIDRQEKEGENTHE